MLKLKIPQTEQITSKYTPFDYTTKQSYGNSSDNVKAAKERLYLLDFYNGNTDSDVFDDELKTAIKDFQKANDLLSYGVLDIPTQKKIEKVFSKIEVTTDNQFEKAYELMGGNLEDLNQALLRQQSKKLCCLR